MHALTIDARALAEPAKQIREEHRLAIECRDSAIRHAIEAGRLLLQVKQNLGHGEFIPWVEAWCPFKYSTAARYMSAAKQISTGVEISSLSTLFPSGRIPRGMPSDRKQDASAAPAARREPRSESSTVAGTPSSGPVVDAGNVHHPEWSDSGAPTEEEIAELDHLTPSQLGAIGANLAEVESERAKARQIALAGTRPTLEPHGSKVETGGTAEIISKKLGIGENTMIAAGEAPEPDEEPAGFYFGGIVPKVLPDGERLQQLVGHLERMRDEAMTAAKGHLDNLKRKTSQCEELETQVRHWRSRVQDLEATEQENEQLRQRITKLEGENERLRERIAIMEEARC